MHTGNCGECSNQAGLAHAIALAQDHIISRVCKLRSDLPQAMASMWMTRPGVVRTLIRHMHQRSAARHGPPPSDLWPKVVVRLSQLPGVMSCVARVCVLPPARTEKSLW